MAMAARSRARWRSTTATIALDNVAAVSAAETGEVGERRQRENINHASVEQEGGTTRVVPRSIRQGRQSLARGARGRAHPGEGAAADGTVVGSMRWLARGRKRTRTAFTQAASLPLRSGRCKP